MVLKVLKTTGRLLNLLIIVVFFVSFESLMYNLELYSLEIVLSNSVSILQMRSCSSTSIRLVSLQEAFL